MSELFALPGALPLLLVAPLVWLGFRALDRARNRRLLQIIGPRARALAPELGRRSRPLLRTLFSLGLLLALIAVTQPLWGVDVRKIERRGIDLVVCLDVSRSMLARDLPPNRLRRAQQEIQALAQRTRGDRLGLVAFAGEAVTTVPLTRDMASFADLVERTDDLSVRRGGTDLGAALETALETFDKDSKSHEAVLLVTDGEDHEQRGLAMGRTCKERNIAVHCAGIGSTLGSKITIDEEEGEAFLRDRTGTEVVSVMDIAGLREITDITGGSYVDTTTSLRPLLELYEKHIRPMARQSFETEERRGRKNRFQWPLLAAILLWLLELWLANRRRR